MYKVAILMSTYNGEKYLREQIDSILTQEGVELTLYIRDDGSSDSTIDIVKEYLIHYSNIKLSIGENVGVGNSFMQMVYDAGDRFDYYAFADQDDVWLDQKLYKGIEAINTYEIPACYCSNQMLVNYEGVEIGKRHIDEICTGYLNILNNNLVTGCTMIWNKKLHLHLCENNRRPSQELLKKRIHDVWVAMVASTIGTIVYDPNSYIEYRQHDNNVVGVKKTSLIDEWKKKISNPSLRNGRSALAKEILEKYQDLLIDRRSEKMLYLYAYYKKNVATKIKLMKEGRISLYSGEPSWQIKAKIFFNLV